jgi:phosphoenolpyruvate carboxykinase (ATP)
VFGFEVPLACEGVPGQVLDPAAGWPDREEYFRRYDALAARFVDNFRILAPGCPPDVASAGPRRLAAVPVG